MSVHARKKHKDAMPHLVYLFGGVLYRTLGFFLVLIVTAHFVFLLLLMCSSQTQRHVLSHGIDEEMRQLHEGATRLAQDAVFQEALKNYRLEDVIAILNHSIDEGSAPAFTATDPQGFVLSRTAIPDRFGDNVFLTTPAGRTLVAKGAVASVEKRSTNDELAITTAQFVEGEDGGRLGALIASAPLTRESLRKMRDEQFNHRIEIASYTRTAGVYATTFDNLDDDALVRSYFHAQSSWVTEGETDKTVSFQNGKYYLTINVVFPGVEESPGGVLLFVPRSDFSAALDILLITLTLCVFFYLLWRAHIRMPQTLRGPLYPLLLFCSALPVVAISFVLFTLRTTTALRLMTPSYPLYNSTIDLSPDWGIYNIGSSQATTIFVHTGDESVNAASATVQYDPSVVRIDKIDTSSSPCSFVIQNENHPELGSFTVSCVILSQPIDSRSFALARIEFTPIAQGRVELSFDNKATQVLANDGLGTNVLRMTGDASYRVGLFDLSDDPPEDARHFIVFSPTHPNESRWYRASFATFVLLGKSDDAYQYVFDANPDTVPVNGTPLLGGRAVIPLEADGVFYFHVQSVNGGPVVHYRVRVDSVPPKILNVEASDTMPHVNDVVRFNFSANDALSGVQNNYYIDMGNGLFLPVGNGVYVPFLETGTHPVTLRVYDQAGNVAEKTIVIHVRK